MAQIGTTRFFSDYLFGGGLDIKAADMHHIPGSDDPFFGAPAHEGETPACSIAALINLLPARVRFPDIGCIEYDGGREFYIYYTYGTLSIEKHDESSKYNNFSGRYKPLGEEVRGFECKTHMPFSYSTDKQEEKERYPNEPFGFFRMIYYLVAKLLLNGYIKTEKNKDYKMWLVYVSFKNEKKEDMSFRYFVPLSKEEIEAKWEERLDDDVDWYHVEECKDFNFGRPEPHTYLIP